MRPCRFASHWTGKLAGLLLTEPLLFSASQRRGQRMMHALKKTRKVTSSQGRGPVRLTSIWMLRPGQTPETRAPPQAVPGHFYSIRCALQKRGATRRPRGFVRQTLIFTILLKPQEDVPQALRQCISGSFCSGYPGFRGFFSRSRGHPHGQCQARQRSPCTSHLRI